VILIRGAPMRCSARARPVFQGRPAARAEYPSDSHEPRARPVASGTDPFFETKIILKGHMDTGADRLMGRFDRRSKWNARRVAGRRRSPRTIQGASTSSFRDASPPTGIGLQGEPGRYHLYVAHGWPLGASPP